MNPNDFVSKITDDLPLEKVQKLATLEYTKLYYESQKSLQEKDQILQEKEQLIKYYEEQLKLNRAKQFGASSEKTPDNQIELDLLFNEAEILTSDVEEPTIEEITYTRKKTKSKNKDLFDNLEIIEFNYKLDDNNLGCECCGGVLHEMSVNTRDELIIVPAVFKIHRHNQYVYSCRTCEKEGTSVNIVNAPAPKAFIKGSMASPSIVSTIISDKFVRHLPLYRQEKSFKDLDVNLSRQTMSNWMLRTADTLNPLYELLKENLLSYKYLHSDETTLKVINYEDKSESRKKAYMWVYINTGENPTVIYDYCKSRSAGSLKEFLGEYSGYMHCDGYNAYKTLSNVELVLCMAHVRRKFDEVLKSLGSKESKTSGANIAIKLIGKLYKIESEIKDETALVKFKVRQEKSKIILDELVKFVNAEVNVVLPKSTYGKALAYAKESLPYIYNFLKDGNLELDNNRSERAIKPFVIGRKNWMFANTERGAEGSAKMYSIVETAKANNLKVRDYLEYILTRIQEGIEDYTEILPWSDLLPEDLKIKQ